MSHDPKNSSLMAGGETRPLDPIEIRGLFPMPPLTALCSQATGDDSTVLTARMGEGHAKLFEYSKDFKTTEFTLVNTSGSQYAGFAAGYAVAFACVAVQHRPGGSVSLRFVPGSVALVAAVAVPTLDEIEEFLGTGRFAILGDLIYYRSADTVVKVRASYARRVANIDDDSHKTGVWFSQDDKATLATRFHSFVDIPIDLAAISALNAGDLYVDGALLPNLPYGGKIGRWQYVGREDGAGVGADLVFRLGIKGTPLTGNDLQLTLATSALPASVVADSAFDSSDFAQGDDLDVELETKTTVFSGGSGILRLEILEYIP